MMPLSQNMKTLLDKSSSFHEREWERENENFRSWWDVFVQQRKSSRNFVTELCMIGNFLFTHSFASSSCEEIFRIENSGEEWLVTFIIEIGDIVK